MKNYPEAQVAIEQFLEAEYDRMNRPGQVIYPYDLAVAAFRKFSRRKDIPVEIEYGAVFQYKQMARAKCAAKSNSNLIHESRQSEFAFAFQERYPRAGSDEGYVNFDEMTWNDLTHNAQRLMKESEAKATHARALLAHRDKLVEDGLIRKPAMEVVA